MSMLRFRVIMRAGQNWHLGAQTLEVKLFHLCLHPLPPCEVMPPYSSVVALRTDVDNEQLTLTLHFPSPQLLLPSPGLILTLIHEAQ